MTPIIYIHSSIDELFLDECRHHCSSVIPCDSVVSLATESIVLCDISALTYESSFIDSAHEKGISPLVIGELTPDNESLCRSMGIARFMSRSECLSHISQLSDCLLESSGVILVVGADPIATTMLRSISELFGYTLACASSVEESRLLVEENPLCVIHDLASSDIDMMTFVKRMSHSALRSLPYVAYKSSGARIDCADLQSGIRTFARVILSLDECYAQTALTLFRLGYYPLMSKLGSLQKNDIDVFGSETLKKIFFAHHDSFFTEHHERVVSSIHESSRITVQMSGLLARFACIEWLLHQGEAALKINEAGVGK